MESPLYTWEGSLHLYQKDGAYSFFYGTQPIPTVLGIEDLASNVDTFCHTHFFHLEDDLSLLVFMEDPESIPKTSFAFGPLEKTREQPKHKRVSKGLNLWGKCTNEKCQEAFKSVLIPKGLGIFLIAREQDAAICPACQTKIPYDKIKNLALFDCIATIEGKKDGIVIKKELTAGNRTFRDFEEDKPVRWDYLKVTTKRRPWLPFCSYL